MKSPALHSPLPPQSPAGVACAVGAYLIWGLNPIYFKALLAVPAFEILMHRMVWSFAFLLPIVLLMGRWPEFKRVISAPRNLLILLGTTILVSGNWFVYIWAINSGRILQTSLGYYINPLINVLLGMVLLRERLRPAQAVAVCLAAAGVIYLTVEIGVLPWISLFLAFSFGFYGLIRKVAPVNALVGLTVETLLLSIPATGYLVFLKVSDSGAFLQGDLRVDILLMCAALFTALPLLLFTTGARKIYFITVGILQYIAPSCTFLLALFVYDEPFRRAQLVTFALIWLALVIFTFDMVAHHRHHSGPVSQNRQ
jgi:chloramphenicol-sensitive protein RarD